MARLSHYQTDDSFEILPTILSSQMFQAPLLLTFKVTCIIAKLDQINSIKISTRLTLQNAINASVLIIVYFHCSNRCILGPHELTMKRTTGISEYWHSSIVLSKALNKCVLVTVCAVVKQSCVFLIGERRYLSIGCTKGISTYRVPQHCVKNMHRTLLPVMKSK